MPKHLKRLQYKEDSIRARKWFEMTKDSSYLEKYTLIDPIKNPGKQKETPEKKNQPVLLAVLPNEKLLYKQRPYLFIIS
jgi:penicillin-binding protein 2